MTQKSSKIPNFDAVYKNENNTWFSSVLPCIYWRIIHGLYHIFYRRVWPPGDHTRLKIWYNPCIIRQYIHGKTDENHVSFSKLSTQVLRPEDMLFKQIQLNDK